MGKEVFDANKIGTIPAATRMADTAVKFNSDKGNKIASSGIDTVRVKKETAKTSKRLNDIAGFSFYTLGPIYAATRVGFDIVGNFANLVGFNEARIIVKLDKPIISNIGEWGYVLEGLPSHYIGSLKMFMATQTAVIPAENIFWCFEHYDITCMDPLGVDRNDIMTPSDTANITLFLPSGNHQRYTTSKDIKYPIELTTALPRQHVITQGKAALLSHKTDSKLIV